jgi:uridylate kinase
MATLVISIGGSILLEDLSSTKYITALADLLKDLSQDHKLFLVVGGGKISRQYIKMARSLGADEASLDELGIACTRLNARILIAALGKEYSYPYPLDTIEETLGVGNDYPITVMGGTVPGHTTDAVAATLAERVDAERLIIATSVDGVYSADPKQDPSAEKFDELTPEKLVEIVSKGEYEGAGPNVVVDLLASKLVARTGIPTYVLDGRDLESLKNAIVGEKFNGTIIRS